MSNKIQDMLRKTEELLKASRNVRANREGLSPETAYGRLKGYHERQGKEYFIDPHGGGGIPPTLSDPVYTGYGSFHPAHEVAHAQNMGFPQEKDPQKPNWQGNTLDEWQEYIDNLDDQDDPHLNVDEDIATQTSVLHARRAGVGLREDLYSIPKLSRGSLYGDTPEEHAKLRRKQMERKGIPGSTLARQTDRSRKQALAIQKVAQLRQKLIDLNIFQMKGGQWEKQTGPNAKINERQFRLEHPEEAKMLLGKGEVQDNLQGQDNTMKIFYHSLPLFKEEPATPAPIADPTVDNAPAEDPPEVPWTAKEHPIFEPKTNMYMISGDNPNYHFNGRPLTEKEKEKGVFRTSNAALVRNLQSRKNSGDPRLKNMTLEVGKGRYTGKDESSVLVTNAPIDIIEDVARQHGQESFVHLPPYPAAIRMVYANGPHRGEHEHGIRESTQTFMEPPADYFTKLPSLNGKYLRFGFNWNNFHKNDENDCPSDTGVFKPKPPKDEQQTQATPQEEPAMKNEKTVEDLKKALAEKLNGLIKEHENFLVGLRKGDMEKKSPPGHEKQVEHIAESYEEKGKSAGQAKAIAAATAWKQHKEHGEHSKEASAPAKKGECCKKCGKAECMGKCDMSDVKKGEPCKKCGGMMKAGYGCAKCDMSGVKPEKSMSKSAVEELATFLATAEKLVKAAKESSAEDSAPLSLADKKMGGKGPKEIPESSEVSAPGSGDDAKAGKPEKAPSMKKSTHNIKAEGSEESSKSKEESSSKEKSKEESSSVSKSLDLVTDLIKAFDHAHAAPSAGLPAHAPVAKQPVLHTHPAGAAIPKAVSHAHPMQGKLDALKARAANMKKPMIPSVK